MKVTFYILKRLAWLWLAVILIYGFFFGFSSVVALVAGTALMIWFYWRVVVMRPRPALAGRYLGNFYGYDFYSSMEVK